MNMITALSIYLQLQHTWLWPHDIFTLANHLAIWAKCKTILEYHLLKYIFVYLLLRCTPVTTSHVTDIAGGGGSIGLLLLLSCWFLEAAAVNDWPWLDAIMILSAPCTTVPRPPPHYSKTSYSIIIPHSHGRSHDYGVCVQCSALILLLRCCS